MDRDGPRATAISRLAATHDMVLTTYATAVRDIVRPGRRRLAAGGRRRGSGHKELPE